MGKKTNKKTTGRQAHHKPEPTVLNHPALNHFRQALNLQMSQDMAGALESYERAIALDPEFADAHFNRGIVLKDLGRFDEAMAAYDRVIAINPDISDAYYNKGNILQILGRSEEALACFDRAICIDPSVARSHNNRGMALKALGRYDEALAAYDQAIVLNPTSAAAYNNRGTALEKLKRYDEALVAYDQAILLNPGFAAAHNNRGAVLQKLKNYTEAISSFDRVLAFNPTLAETHNNRGAALKELGRYEEALTAFDRAVAMNPVLAEAHNNRGAVLKELARYEEALAACDRAIGLDSAFADAHGNRGAILQALMRYDEALTAYERATSLNPASVEAHYNRGIALQEMNRFDEALAAHDRALVLNPDYSEALNNRGITLQELKRYDEALEAFDRAVAVKPDNALGQFNRSLLLLLRGNYAHGWRLYEWRWRKKGETPPRNLWLGDESIKEKTILLYHEQGFGDTLQMMRYVPLLASQGARVFVEVPSPLLALAKETSGVAGAWIQGENLPEVDRQCPFMSLPLAFKTTLETIPASVPYLKVPEDKVTLWQNRLAGKTRPRIGLVWSGGTIHKTDIKRSIPLSVILPLLDANAEFHSLQIEYREEDAEILRNDHRIRNHAGEIADFADTAALIHQMDLIISADTAVAHLAGALGKPVWIMLPYSPDFRWLADREDSPWYPTARLFRQPVPGSWNKVIEKIKEAIPGILRIPAWNQDSRESLQQLYKSAWDFHQSGALEEALAVYERIRKTDSENPVLHFNRGNILQELKRSEEALNAWDRAIALRPDFVEAHTNRGLVLLELGKLQEALEAQDRAITVKPDFAAAHSNRGMILQQLGKQDEALEAFDRAIAIDPGYVEAYGNRGMVLMKLNQYDEALAAFDKAIALNPALADSHYNRGFILHRQKKYNEALAAYNQAIDINPQHVQSQWNKSLLFLLHGNYEEGWRLYEWRWRLQTYRPYARSFAKPLWLGDGDVSGKTLLLYREQGYGDTLQMLRYVPLLIERGATVILSVARPLMPLANLIPGAACIADKETPLPDFDLHCPFMSLPLAFQTTPATIPSTVPYLKVPAQKKTRWQSLLGEKTGTRIGLVWSGVAAYGYDRERSIPLSALLPLLDRKAGFHSLQIQYRDTDLELLSVHQDRLLNHSDKIVDFGDTAALIDEMDLIISVDTSVAHLAGALGKPVWILLPWAPDFRWLLDREDSPWYPTARLFRQPAFNAWDKVVERLMAEKI